MPSKPSWLQTSKLGSTGQWEGVAFFNMFPGDPVLISSIMTYQGGDTVTTRIRDLDASGFDVAMDEQESKHDGHLEETLGWIAIEAGSTITTDGRRLQAFFTQIDHNLTSVPFGLRTTHRYPSVIGDIDSAYGMDPVFLRYANPTNTKIDFKLAEEQSLDAEIGHTLEDVGVFVGE